MTSGTFLCYSPPCLVMQDHSQSLHLTGSTRLAPYKSHQLRDFRPALYQELYVGVRDPNTDPQACTARTLLTGPSWESPHTCENSYTVNELSLAFPSLSLRPLALLTLIW